MRSRGLPRLRGVVPLVPVSGVIMTVVTSFPPPTTTKETAMAEQNTPGTDEALVEETLVEEVSIDGMCGVY